MGNSLSGGQFEDVELAPHKQRVVVIDERFVNSDAITRLYVDNATSPYAKDLEFKDPKKREVVFCAGQDAELRTLLDASKKPVVKVAKKHGVDNIWYVYRPEAAPETNDAGVVLASDESELFQIYFKLGWKTRSNQRDTTLRVDFTDQTTGDRCKVELDGQWHMRGALLWLDRPSSNTRLPLGRVFRPTHAMMSEYYVEIAPNVDAAFVMAICAVLDEEVKREQREDSKDVYTAMATAKSPAMGSFYFGS